VCPQPSEKQDGALKCCLFLGLTLYFRIVLVISAPALSCLPAVFVAFLLILLLWRPVGVPWSLNEEKMLNKAQQVKRCAPNLLKNRTEPSCVFFVICTLYFRIVVVISEPVFVLFRIYFRFVCGFCYSGSLPGCPGTLTSKRSPPYHKTKT
jgi:hypothetical protein